MSKNTPEDRCDEPDTFQGDADFSLIKKRKRTKSTVETHGVSSELLNMVKSGMLTLVQARKIFKEGMNAETPGGTTKRPRDDSDAEYPVVKVSSNSPSASGQSNAAPTLSKVQDRSSALKTAETKRHLEKNGPSRIDKDPAIVTGIEEDTPQSSSSLSEGRNSIDRLTHNPSSIDAELQNDYEKNIMQMKILDVRSKDTQEKVAKMRLCGEPFILVGHDKFTEFASSWNMYKKSPKTFEISDIPSKLRRLVVPVIKKGERSATSFHPINSKMPLEEFFERFWKKSDPLCYLHQWQFPVESKAGRKHMGAKSVQEASGRLKSNGSFSFNEHLPPCMDTDLLEFWRTDLDGTL